MIWGISLNLIPYVFYGLGIAYCFYVLIFRWTALRKEYGSMSLYWWMGAVLAAFSISGWLVAVAIWLLQRQFAK